MLGTCVQDFSGQGGPPSVIIVLSLVVQGKGLVLDKATFMKRGG
jgi:hypothetical protein